MSDENELRVRAPLREVAQHPRPADFDEVPGEAEADAARDAFLHGAGVAPATQAAALAGVDDGLRERAVSRLQRQRGNRYIQRLVAAARELPGRMVGLSQAEMVGEVQARKGSGSPLPAATRQQMEEHFGADLGSVRVHAGDEAAALNREVDARAFTVGRDIFFAAGEFDPGSRTGQGLIAHELAHVGQQTGFDQ